MILGGYRKVESGLGGPILLTSMEVFSILSHQIWAIRSSWPLNFFPLFSCRTLKSTFRGEWWVDSTNLIEGKQIIRTSLFLFQWKTSGQIITTSAEVTPNGGLVRESPPNPLNSGLGIIVICPETSSSLQRSREGNSESRWCQVAIVKTPAKPKALKSGSFFFLPLILLMVQKSGKLTSWGW